MQAERTSKGPQGSQAEPPITALTFVMGREVFAVDVDGVTEITTLHRITPIPGAMNWVRGIMNLRGRVIPVVDGRERLGLTPRDYDAGTCILIMEHDDITVGVVVDEVRDVIELSLSDVEPAPVALEYSARCIRGLHQTGDQVHLVLDLPALLS